MFNETYHYLIKLLLLLLQIIEVGIFGRLSMIGEYESLLKSIWEMYKTLS